MDQYSIETRAGRDYAERLISECAVTGNVPRLVNAIRDAAADENTTGIGFIYQCAILAISQNAKKPG